MSEFDRMHDYLNDQTFYDYKVRELYDKKVSELKSQLAEAREEIKHLKKKNKLLIKTVEYNVLRVGELQEQLKGQNDE